MDEAFIAHLRTKGIVKIGLNSLGVITNLTREGSCSLGYNDIELMWETWQAANAVPEGFVVVPKEPSYKMWSGIARHLCRYAQTHDRYNPKSLKKYFDRFIGDIPDWLNAEVSDWESDHAFATADIGAFIYKAMIAAQEPAND